MWYEYEDKMLAAAWAYLLIFNFWVSLAWQRWNCEWLEWECDMSDDEWHDGMSSWKP